VGAAVWFTPAVTGSAPITYTWDFGDGSPVLAGLGLAPVTHTYTAVASYPLTVTVENFCPSQDTYATTIDVEQVGDAPDIKVTPTSFALAATMGEKVVRSLTIANEGLADLTWALEEDPEVGWLTVTPLSGTVAPTGTTPLTVTFDATGLALGTYTTTFVIDSNDPDEDPFVVPVALTVGLYPDIEVTPTSFAVTLPLAASKGKQLSIANVGHADLTWALVESPAVGWLTEVPDGPATVAPGESDLVIVSFNTSGLMFGKTYTTTLLINSDDPNEATVEVPVALTVDFFRRYLPIIMLTRGP
jgi:PKD repeat protein